MKDPVRSIRESVHTHLLGIAVVRPSRVVATRYSRFCVSNFAAGKIYGLITGRPAEEPLRLGWAHGALLTTFPGDVTMAKLSEVEALAKEGTARVQRQSYEPRPADVKIKLRLKVEPTDVRSIRYFAW